MLEDIEEDYIVDASRSLAASPSGGRRQVVANSSLTAWSEYASGVRASIPKYGFGRPDQAKILVSLETLMISSCNRTKAHFPSPYNRGRFTSNIPNRL